MSEQQTSGPPAGWYPHPTMAGTQRYWDGATWTDHIAPGTPQHLQAAAETQNNDTLIRWGVLLAIFLPIGGFIIGCILMSKRATTAGALILIGSVAVGIFWFNAITSYEQSQCVNDNLDRAINGGILRDCG